MSKVKVGIVESRFQADCIAAAMKAMPEEGDVVAVETGRVVQEVLYAASSSARRVRCA
jgi:hypothetical protein